ncbi:PRC-barrel domain-containing protein [Selenomonas sputigena]|uniref:PRC-barrel domain protein n=1 Tax=Selenomonas sputigena (strain ATCC 35185 / DSM 20758 / CCUG 44933 / VPI D19B-28) TaxID=546271 RepID=C9LRJ6_SELS3|nr:PRC-barrel domain-containing protein [Selenomonas sputigena]AEC00889.1 PRC-barrel domain protein [Selenomonas sputigena ATCC 35185]EEX78462.1 PRC-barrel domain protein [Selenomonas sputigena ATCC 35185]
MKTSAEILGLPVISITEGRELGMSKTLLIDAKNGAVAAITIEDDDWYRGVKLIPFESVIAVGADAITITNSENILTLEDAVDFENLLDENVRIIGTKAITKAGTIQGSVSEIYIGDDGKVVQCEISDPQGNFLDNISAEQISIFGKQVTVIDSGSVAATAAPAMPAAETPAAPAFEAAPTFAEPPVAEPVAEAAPEPVPETPAVPDMPAAEPVEEPAPESVVEPAAETPAEVPAPEPAAAPEAAEDPAEKAAAKATEDRHRRFLLNKKASRRITTDTGVVIVEAGGDITEEVLQKAKLANKIIELSMNVQ